MARREELDNFISDLFEHEENNPNETPAVLIAVMVDPDTGRVWVSENVYVSQAVLFDIEDAIERGESVDPIESDDEPDPDEA